MTTTSQKAVAEGGNISNHIALNCDKDWGACALFDSGR